MLVFSLLIFSLLISVPLQAQAQTSPNPSSGDAEQSARRSFQQQNGTDAPRAGFPAEQTQANAAQQALLDKRTHMLKIHQRMGLITTAPLIATVIASMGAGAETPARLRETARALGG